MRLPRVSPRLKRPAKAAVATVLIAALAMVIWSVMMRAPEDGAVPAGAATQGAKDRTSAEAKPGAPAGVGAPTHIENLPAAVAAESAPAVAPEKVIARFAEWTQEYLQASPKERAVLLQEGVALAQQRRPIFKQLIQSDPRRALADAVPVVARQQLPQSVVNFIEERVAGRAVLRVYQSTPAAGEAAVGTSRVAEFQNGGTYSAFVFGRRAEKVTWTPDASLNGVALDRQLAVSDDPLRVLEVGEIPNPAKPAVTVCPVSGLKTAAPSAAEAHTITRETPAVEVYGEIVYLCNGSHTTIYRQTIIQAEGGTGGPTTFTGLLPAAPTPSLGTLKILYIHSPSRIRTPCPRPRASATRSCAM